MDQRTRTWIDLGPVTLTALGLLPLAIVIVLVLIAWL